jgi:hypothetical protein
MAERAEGAKSPSWFLLNNFKKFPVLTCDFMTFSFYLFCYESWEFGEQGAQVEFGEQGMHKS